jgi:hypothetical protein
MKYVSNEILYTKRTSGLFAICAVSALAGSLWLLSACVPWLAVLSLAVLLFLPPQMSRWQDRLLVAFLYLVPATASIVPSYSAFFHTQPAYGGVAVWLVVAFLLALPWMLARGPWSTLLASSLSGVIGPLSVWPLVGVLFPGTGPLGLIPFVLVVLCAGELGALLARGRPATLTDSGVWILLGFAVLTNITTMMTPKPRPPAGWVAVNTHEVQQTGNDVFAGLRATQQVIDAGLAHPAARVLVFPEAVLDNMLPGTVSMVSQAVPQGQTWLIGAEDGQHDATWRFQRGKPPVLVSDSVLPMPVSMWRPWQLAVSYQPAWHKAAFEQSGKQVWASICYEQVLPWSWLQALWAQPELVLLQSNGWWASRGNSAPSIQRAQAYAWIRLMGLPVVEARNTQQ